MPAVYSEQPLVTATYCQNKSKLATKKFPRFHKCNGLRCFTASSYDLNGIKTAINLLIPTSPKCFRSDSQTKLQLTGQSTIAFCIEHRKRTYRSLSSSAFEASRPYSGKHYPDS
ncbi:hypothetical protein NC653_010393 [Populus alba x Populus x berolinensis]|uniref:Uncharacterized protein n=1 Tax=Populus alba x Populus x berolinensis TaxID=444605 RepID=A0AAD6QZN3_9ROSI|nr:hypothetical protein NC653_010393 [Populus alba x Populus x berolinensis]